jgi:hypothetical protein
MMTVDRSGRLPAIEKAHGDAGALRANRRV